MKTCWYKFVVWVDSWAQHLPLPEPLDFTIQEAAIKAKKELEK